MRNYTKKINKFKTIKIKYQLDENFLKKKGIYEENKNFDELLNKYNKTELGTSQSKLLELFNINNFLGINKD